MTKEMYHLMDHKAYKVYKNIYVCLYTYTQNNSKDNQLLLFRSLPFIFVTCCFKNNQKKKSVVKPTHPYLTMILLILPVFPIFFFILMLSAV